VSVFEAHTEIIRKGKASTPTEFGKLVKIQESENQIISHFEVFAERPSDRQLLVPSIEVHQRRFGRIPAWVAADAGFHSQQNEKTAGAWACDGFRCRIRRPRVRNANDFIGSVGFVVDNGGEPDAILVEPSGTKNGQQKRLTSDRTRPEASQRSYFCDGK